MKTPLKEVNVVIVFDPSETRLLFCLRKKPPYLGLFNFVGGKLEPNEDGLAAAYRELFEETGITAAQIHLRHVFNFEYLLSGIRLMVYAGRLNQEVALREEANPLVFLSADEDFFDSSRFAGEGNIGHMLRLLKDHRASIAATTFTPAAMTREAALSIATWQYPPPYGQYSFSPNEDTLAELLCGNYYSMQNQGRCLCGYACFGKSAQIPTLQQDPYQSGFIDLGLGLKPSLCGEGLGAGLLAATMELGRATFGQRPFRLSVLSQNERAKRLYLRHGFSIEKTVHHRHSKQEFLIMVKP